MRRFSRWLRAESRCFTTFVSLMALVVIALSLPESFNLVLLILVVVVLFVLTVPYYQGGSL